MLVRMTPGPPIVIDCDGSPDAVLALASALQAALHGSGPAVLPVPQGARSRVLAALRPDEPADERAAVVVATSGSTGTPKGVELAATALCASAMATHERLGGTGSWLLALPAAHIAGVQVLVRSLLSGRAPVVLDLRDGFTAAAFAAAARTMSAGRRYTALVPTQLVRLLEADGAGLQALRQFDAVLIGGAACPVGLRERAIAAGVAVVTTYGMTETAGGCVYDDRPLQGVQVRISPKGRIELGGATLALGYRLDPAATAAAFRHGWLRTGDRGRLSANGDLQVLGRFDEMIATGGHKVAPDLVERALVAVPGVAEACVVGVADPEWGQLVAAAVVPRDPGAPPSPAALRSSVRELAGPAAVPKVIRLVDALPHNDLGKINRAAVHDLLTPP